MAHRNVCVKKNFNAPPIFTDRPQLKVTRSCRYLILGLAPLLRPLRARSYNASLRRLEGILARINLLNPRELKRTLERVLGAPQYTLADQYKIYETDNEVVRRRCRIDVYEAKGCVIDVVWYDGSTDAEVLGAPRLTAVDVVLGLNCVVHESAKSNSGE